MSIEKRPSTIEVDRRLYEAYLDFIGRVRNAEKTADTLSDLEELIVRAINELDLHTKG